MYNSILLFRAQRWMCGARRTGKPLTDPDHHHTRIRAPRQIVMTTENHNKRLWTNAEGYCIRNKLCDGGAGPDAVKIYEVDHQASSECRKGDIYAKDCLYQQCVDEAMESSIQAETNKMGENNIVTMSLAQVDHLIVQWESLN